MQSLKDTGTLSTRRNTHMRSLLLEYPRMNERSNVLVDLFDLQKVDMKVNLPVLSADTSGIELKFPSWLTGMFYLKVQDGEQSFLRKIAIQ
ncbi:MAG TPA: hypothetical protein VFG10_01155 [Saprospiraceae bacterium]|nr:hypothetical protein [Saprospiraceae bacterium]